MEQQRNSFNKDQNRHQIVSLDDLISFSVKIYPQSNITRWKTDGKYKWTGTENDSIIVLWNLHKISTWLQKKSGSLFFPLERILDFSSIFVIDPKLTLIHFSKWSNWKTLSDFSSPSGKPVKQVLHTSKNWGKETTNSKTCINTTSYDCTMERMCYSFVLEQIFSPIYHTSRKHTFTES